MSNGPRPGFVYHLQLLTPASCQGSPWEAAGLAQGPASATHVGNPRLCSCSWLCSTSVGKGRGNRLMGMCVFSLLSQIILNKTKQKKAKYFRVFRDGGKILWEVGSPEELVCRPIFQIERLSHRRPSNCSALCILETKITAGCGKQGTEQKWG